jgi:hypothetical protein
MLAVATAGVFAFSAPAQAAIPGVPAPISAPEDCKGVAPLVRTVTPIKASDKSDKCALGAGHSVGLATAGLIAGAATGTAKGLGK